MSEKQPFIINGLLKSMKKDFIGKIDKNVEGEKIMETAPVSEGKINTNIFFRQRGNPIPILCQCDLRRRGS